MARRDPDAVRRALEDPGFTPARRDIPALVAMLPEVPEALVARIERALLDHPSEAAARVSEALSAAQGDRARVVHAAGRLAAQGAIPWSALHATLDDADASVRRAGMMALAQSTDPETEAALLDAWGRMGDVAPPRALIRALGRVGAERALVALSAWEPDDPRLDEELSRARLMLQRRAGRDAPSGIDGRAKAPAALAVDIACRPGLERVCAEEFTDAFLPAVAGPGRVQVTLRGALDDLSRCRVMTSFSFPLATAQEGELPEVVAEAIASDESLAILRAFTRGTIRYRIEWADAGHRRGATWRCVSAVAARRPELMNDPREATWDVVVSESRDRVRVSLRPRRWEDPRFTYRVADVPAASHPTVAAALASFAGVRPDDVVWDPFVGSGLELIERARRGPYARMIGTDLDATALDAAKKNLAAAGVERVTLRLGDACEDAPEGVSLILSNPPHGHRAGFGRDPAALLVRFLPVAWKALRPGGRIVWLSPAPEETARVGRALGMTVRAGVAVDLGGIPVTLQSMTK